MLIALFTIDNLLACHYATFGYRDTLERMGHDVLEFKVPGNQVRNVPEVRRKAPTIERLNEFDLVLSTYHEYMQPWLEALYDFEAWKLLKPPVVARYDESMDRLDLGLPARLARVQAWAQHHFFPAVQDAKKFHGQWLPFGADTTIFNTGSPLFLNSKVYELAFIGTLYRSRHEYLEKLVVHVEREVLFRCGNVFVQDLSGVNYRESTKLLAENYRKIKLFFCLPPISRLIVEKVFDVMACNTFVLYPRLYGEAAENLSLFEDGKHIVYYDVGHFAENGKQITYFLDHAAERERIARAGGEFVRSHYTLEGMLTSMLAVKESARESVSAG